MSDDIIKRLRRDLELGSTASGRVFSASPDNIAAILDELDRLRAENEALAADARRYRWLTDNSMMETSDGTVGIDFWADEENWNDIAAAIDAAMAAEKGEA